MNNSRSIGASLGLKQEQILSKNWAIHVCSGIALIIIATVILAKGWEPDSLTLSATVGSVVLLKIFNDLARFGLSTTKDKSDPCYQECDSGFYQFEISANTIYAVIHIGLAILTYTGDLSTTELATGIVVTPLAMIFGGCAVYGMVTANSLSGAKYS